MDGREHRVPEAGDAAALALEDGRPDLPDGVVEPTDDLGEETVDLPDGPPRFAAYLLDGEGGGEQASDHDVVEAGSGPLVVGDREPLLIPGPKLVDHGRSPTSTIPMRRSPGGEERTLRRYGGGPPTTMGAAAFLAASRRAERTSRHFTR